MGGRGSRREYCGGWWEEGGHGENMVEDGGRKVVMERICGRWWEEGGHVKFMDLYLAGGSPGPPLANIVVYGRLSP